MTTTPAERGGAILRGYPIAKWRPGDGRLRRHVVLKVEEARLGFNAHMSAANAKANREAILAWARSVGLGPHMLMFDTGNSGIPYLLVPIRYFKSHVLPELQALQDAPAVVADETADEVEDLRRARFARLPRRFIIALAVWLVCAGIVVYAGVSTGVSGAKVINVFVVAYFGAIGLIAGSLYYGHRAAGRSKLRSLAPVALLIAVFTVPAVIALQYPML